jgi:hypothetical protein
LHRRVPDGPHSFTLAVQAPGLATGQFTGIRASGAPLTLRLRPAARLEGLIAAEDAQPIAGASVTLSRQAARGRRQPVARRARAPAPSGRHERRGRPVGDGGSCGRPLPAANRCPRPALLERTAGWPCAPASRAEST